MKANEWFSGLVLCHVASQYDPKGSKAPSKAHSIRNAVLILALWAQMGPPSLQKESKVEGLRRSPSKIHPE